MRSWECVGHPRDPSSRALLLARAAEGHYLAASLGNAWKAVVRAEDALAVPPALDDAVRYVVVVLENGVASYPLAAHLYDLGPGRGYRVVGIERPESTRVDPSERGITET